MRPYDGSVIAGQTRGKSAAPCDREEANFPALNPMNDCMTGKKSVQEARKFHAGAMREMKPSEYKKGFQFEVARTDQGDPDQ